MKKILSLLIACAIMVGIMCSCNSKQTDFSINIKYLPVKLENSAKWSILSLETGEIVVKDTFAYEPSAIINDMFYVPNDDGTFCYYSMSDPTTPVIAEKFGSVTIFSDDGVAVASRRGGPLCVINKKCEVVAQLPNDVVACSMFNHGRAIFRTELDLAGYINTRGEVVVPAKFVAANAFLHDDVAIVTQAVGDSAFDITAIDLDGKQLFTLSSLDNNIITPYFSLGTLPVMRGDSVVWLDKKGETVVNPDRAYATIEAQKYDNITTTPEMTYIVSKDGKHGVVNEKNEVFIPLKYDNIACLAPNRYVVLADTVISLVDRKGVAVGNNRIAMFQSGPNDIFAIRGYIDTSVAAMQYLNMVGPDFCAGVLKGSTLMDLNALVGDDAAPYVGVSTLPHSDGSVVVLYYFDDFIAKKNQDGAPEFNYGARLVSVSVSSNLTHCGLKTEQEILDKVSTNLGSRGFIYAKDDVFVSGANTLLALGYNGGVFNMFYFFDPRLAQPLPHNPRQ